VDAFLIDCVRSQVDAFLAELDRIEGSEFPYRHSNDCVVETKDLFLAHREVLSEITPESDAGSVELACNTALSHVRNNLDLLGFLLRSTNVRNAFEAYGPLLRMASTALGAATRLVISSEWMFSPFTYVGVPHLPNTVLVGLPATESGNPLLLPLAGHEFGHTAWAHFKLDADMRQKVETAIIADIQANWPSLQKYFPETKPDDVATDLLARALWMIAWSWAKRQCEEYFCDFFGLHLFGEGFLDAFAYLLAPYRKGKRTPSYPALVDRSRALADAALKLGVPVVADYSKLFGELPAFSPDEERENALLSLADRVSTGLIPDLNSRVQDLLKSSGAAPQSEDKISGNLKRFSFRVPAERAGGIANILAAAWRARLDPALMGLEKMDPDSKTMLAEIVWKSIEIDEIEYRLAQHS
jgi:hypothetical protein